MHAEQNPYAAPSTSVDPPPADQIPVDVDRELAATQLSGMVKAASGTVVGTGAMLVLGALQLWDVVRLQGLYRAVPLAMALCGVASVVLGLKVYRQRAWAAVAATVLSGLVVLLMGGWFILSTLSGFISVLAMLVPLIAALATIFSGLAIGPCGRAAAARRRLAAGGLDVDF
jgi:hypothetical protein